LSHGDVVAPRPTIVLPDRPPYLDLVAHAHKVDVDPANEKVTFSLEIYNAGSIGANTPFRVDISVTRKTVLGQILANSVQMLEINSPIPPYSFFTTPGNTDPLIYFDKPPHVKYEIESLIDPEFNLPDVNRSNNFRLDIWHRPSPEALSKLPLKFESKSKESNG